VRDARWGRIVEGAGEDPYLGAAMAVAQVRGFQGESIGRESVLACVKHFAGYGAAEGGRDYDASYIPESLFRNVYLVPFHAAEKAGAATFMSAYMDLNDVPASGNRWLLHDILRQEWGFKGFVVSDAFAVGKLETHGYARDPKDAAYKAITAGVDMDMASLTYIRNLPRLVASGKVKEAQLDAAVLPILEAKYQLGLFDDPYVDESTVDAALSGDIRQLSQNFDRSSQRRFEDATKDQRQQNNSNLQQVSMDLKRNFRDKYHKDIALADASQAFGSDFLRSTSSSSASDLNDRARTAGSRTEGTSNTNTSSGNTTGTGTTGTGTTGTPSARCSRSYQEAPMPSRPRPPETTSSVVTIFASSPGCRYITPVTSTPSVMRRVKAAT